MSTQKQSEVSCLLTHLVELAKMGDKPAFDEVIRMCIPDLFRIAMSILRNKDDADDAVCETVVCTYENLNTLKNCNYFKTWITRILINQANTTYKKRKRIIYIDEISEPQYEDNYNLGDGDLGVAVNLLNLELRTVITLFYFQEMRIKEIASVLKISESTVKWRLSRAKKILKQELENKEGLENA
jgi:RNA polymerase sigma-70 factor (ECF subfamily)